MVSMIGRTDYARVKIVEDDLVEPVAISGAAILSSTTEADGFVIVPADSEGYAPETEVEVFLYDQYHN
jgi:molybdopterin molybdotransferase